MNKIITAEKAMGFVKSGSTLMIGGFMGNGTPNILNDGIVKKGCKNLTVIGNDAAVPSIQPRGNPRF